MQQPVPAVVAWPASRGYYYKPRMDRELLQHVRQPGIIAHHRLPRPARCRPGCASATTTRPRRAAAEFRDIFGADNFYLELMDHGLRHRAAGAASDLLRLARTSACRLVATNDLHYTLRRRRRRRTRCCCACSPARPWPTRTGSSSTADDFYLKTPQEMRALWARAARGLRQHPARSPSAATVDVPPRAPTCMPRFHVPDGRDARSPGSSRRSSAACAARYRGGVPAGIAGAGRLRGRASSCQMGFPGYFLVVADLIAWCARSSGIRVGPGRGSGRRLAASPTRCGITELDPHRARAAVRAVPQPRPRLDARHRHRLRRASARRRDPLRHREVRRGPRRARSSPTARSRPSRPSRTPPACSATRSRLGDRITKVDAAAGHGQGHPARRHLRRRPTSATSEAGEFRAPLRDRRRGSRRSSTPPSGLEGLKRQWGVHAAGVIMSSEPLHRHHPDHAPRAGRRDHHRSSTIGRLRGRSACSRWTSSACATSRSSTTALANIAANRGIDAGARAVWRSTDRRRYELLGRGDTLGVFQLDGGPMRSLLRSMRPDIVRRHLRGRWRSTGPARWAPNAHNDYADRKNGRKPVVADPSRAGRAAGRDPRRRPTA